MLTRTRKYCLACLLGTAFAFSSCISDDVYDAGTDADGDTYINLCVTTTNGDADTRQTSTRAADDEVEGTSEENAIKSLRVWIYNSEVPGDEAMPVGYAEELSLPEGNSSSYKLSVKIPRKSGGEVLSSIDMFILANAESCGQQTNFSGPLSRGDLSGATMSGVFGVSNVVGGISNDGEPQATAVPEDGLPMSRVVTGISVDTYKNETPNGSNVISIPLIRSVSKLNFYFARKESGDTENAIITRITLDDNTFPKDGWTFTQPTALSSIASSGLTGAEYTGEYYGTATLGIAAPNPVNDPTTLKRTDDETAEQYKARLAAAGVTPQHVTYFAETARAVSGTIYYKAGGSSDSEHSVQFTLPAGSGNRNHEKLIYAYFTEDNLLNLQYSILPWKGHDTNVETQDATFLMVYPEEIIMRNIAEDNSATFYASGECEIEITEVYYYDKNNDKTSIAKGAAQYPNITIGSGQTGKITVKSAVPTNATAKYIRFKVKLKGSDLEKEVLVKQYPLEYIIQSITGWYSTKNLNNWIDWEYDSQNRSNTQKTYRSSNPTFRTIVYEESKGMMYYYEHKGSGFGGNQAPYKAEKTDEVTNKKNNHMYVVQITKTTDKYKIGHPINIDPNKHTSQEDVVSPAFMIASQLGVTLSYSGTDGSGPAQHCYDYVEVGTDKKRWTGWRLPTKQEIQVIVDFQENSEVMDVVLAGNKYWALSGDKVTAKTKGDDAGDNAGFVRCIRDLTPEEVKALEEKTN